MLQPPEKSHPPFLSNPTPKNWDPIKPPPFENLVGGSTAPHPPPCRKGEVHTDFWYCFFAMSVCAFNSLPNEEYSNLFIVAAFSNKFFSGKTSLPVKNSCLLEFPDNKSWNLSSLSV